MFFQEDSKLWASNLRTLGYKIGFLIILKFDFCFRSELYSPTKSDIYGSKSEFMFGHNPSTATPTSNRNSYFGGHSTRPSSIYSPVGTLTRRGSKVTPMSGQTSGVNGERGVEESGNFYESDSGVSSLYEPLSFNGGNGGSSLQLMNPHSTSQHRYSSIIFLVAKLLYKNLPNFL